MDDSLFFATFDPLFVNAPETCTLCIVRPPAFNYEYAVEKENGQRTYEKGYCCTACAVNLMQKLEAREAGEWQEEEAAMEADHLDIADLQKRRLATFGAD
jgi:hypothetical protein